MEACGRSEDAGRSWIDCELPEPGVFSVAVSPSDGAVYAGTEPSRLFRSNDRGRTWRELAALLELPSRQRWSFPPRPWTSHVRWIAPSPHDARLLLVGIELGGLMRSDRRRRDLAGSSSGRAARRPLARLASRRSPGAPTRRAAAVLRSSSDAGETWQPADEGRDRQLHLVGRRRSRTTPTAGTCRRVPARSPRTAGGDPQARIVSATRAGSRGGRSRGGLPDPLPSMPYALVAAEGRLFAGLADGQVWAERRPRRQLDRVASSTRDALPSLVALGARLCRPAHARAHTGVSAQGRLQRVEEPEPLSSKAAWLTRDPASGSVASKDVALSIASPRRRLRPVAYATKPVASCRDRGRGASRPRPVVRARAAGASTAGTPPALPGRTRA